MAKDKRVRIPAMKIGLFRFRYRAIPYCGRVFEVSEMGDDWAICSRSTLDSLIEFAIKSANKTRRYNKTKHWINRDKQVLNFFNKRTRYDLYLDLLDEDEFNELAKLHGVEYASKPENRKYAYRNSILP